VGPGIGLDAGVAKRIYKTIILLLVLYGHEIWFLALREGT